MPKQKIINQDGKTYTFTPGQNGSLSYPAPQSMLNLPDPKTGQGKVVMPPNQGPTPQEQLAMKTRRRNIAQTLAVRD